ncbi:hypothetical protein Tco_0480786 [Tanacetum coccineum]
MGTQGGEEGRAGEMQGDKRGTLPLTFSHLHLAPEHPSIPPSPILYPTPPRHSLAPAGSGGGPPRVGRGPGRATSAYLPPFLPIPPPPSHPQTVPIPYPQSAQPPTPAIPPTRQVLAGQRAPCPNLQRYEGQTILHQCQGPWARSAALPLAPEGPPTVTNAPGTALSTHAAAGEVVCGGDSRGVWHTDTMEPMITTRSWSLRAGGSTPHPGPGHGDTQLRVAPSAGPSRAVPRAGWRLSSHALVHLGGPSTLRPPVPSNFH